MRNSPYSDSWVYEGIIGAVPGTDPDPRIALALQFLVFELAVLALAAIYRLPEAAVVGTVAVLISTAGSALLLRIGGKVRSQPVPDRYKKLLFGSNIEIVLGVFSFIGLVTYLFVVDPRYGDRVIIAELLGPQPPVPAVFLMLLILWDVCYRIGAGWWASVTACWRSFRFSFPSETARTLRSADLDTILFGLIQLGFLPFLLAHPILFLILAGHILAVLLVTGSSIWLLSRSQDAE